MSDLASVINQPPLLLLRSLPLNLQAPKTCSKAACSCFSHVLQVFLKYLHSSGAFELAHVTGRKTLAGKQTWSRIRGLHHPLPTVLLPFALHKRVQETKSSNGARRNLKVFDPDEERQQCGGADGGTAADGVGFRCVRRRRRRDASSNMYN